MFIQTIEKSFKYPLATLCPIEQVQSCTYDSNDRIFSKFQSKLTSATHGECSQCCQWRFGVDEKAQKNIAILTFTLKLTQSTRANDSYCWQKNVTFVDHIFVGSPHTQMNHAYQRWWNCKERISGSLALKLLSPSAPLTKYRNKQSPIETK